MRNIGLFLALSLPFKHCVCVEFQLQYRCDKWSRRFIVHCLEGSQVLLDSVVQTTQFLSCTIFQRWGFYDHTYVRLMYQTWTIIARFQAFNGFTIELTRAGKTFNNFLG